MCRLQSAFSIILAGFMHTFASVMAAVPDSIPLVRIELERLPDMNVPRTGHAVFCVNGEVVVAGGHTLGFKPTATAEYFREGQWHLIPMAYPHDDGFGAVLSSGQVMLGGGHDRNLGQGQTFEVEMYHPATHTFEGFGSLDRKRALATAVEIDSGRVVIAGNWYADDGIEVYDGKGHFLPAGDVSVQRTMPLIFPTSNGDALIFSSYGTKGERIGSNVVDCLKGGRLHIPLLDTWHPTMSFDLYNQADCSIGDYSYLLYLLNNSGEKAVAQLSDTVMTLLPTTHDIPQCSPWDSINYIQNFICDRSAKRAYLFGYGSSCRLYVLCVDYSKSPAPLILYYTDPMPKPAMIYTPVLIPEGHLLIAGGYSVCDDISSNFKPTSAAWLLHVGPKPPSEDVAMTWTTWWWIVALVVLLLGIAFFLMRRRRIRTTSESDNSDEADVHDESNNDIKSEEPNNSSPYVRLRQLMEEEQLFLNSELRLQDVAVKLGINSRYVSDCIKSESNCTFSQFVNMYRVEHAKQLLREQPDMKLSVVCTSSGFSGESSFFRTFRSIVGMTPREWLESMGRK